MPFDCFFPFVRLQKREDFLNNKLDSLNFHGSEGILVSSFLGPLSCSKQYYLRNKQYYNYHYGLSYDYHEHIYNIIIKIIVFLSHCTYYHQYRYHQYHSQQVITIITFLSSNISIPGYSFVNVG